VDILYVTNFLNTQPQYNLNSFLTNQKSCRVFILHLSSLPDQEKKYSYHAAMYSNHKILFKFDLVIRQNIPHLLKLFFHYFINFIIGVKFVLNNKAKFDIGFGESNFGGFFIYFLKLIGFVKKTIFMNGDIIPISFRTWDIRNIIQKKIQFQLRKFAYNNNLIWYTRDEIKVMDRIIGLKSSSVVTIPAVTIVLEELYKNLLFPDKIYDLAYIGRLDTETGIDLLLQSLAIARRKNFPKNVIIIGGSEKGINRYRQIVKSLNIEDLVVFTGYVKSRTEVMEILRKSMYGFAMYEPKNYNLSQYTDNGKIKDYIQAGIPVITTESFNENSKELKIFGASIEINFKIEDLADLFTSDFGIAEKGTINYDMSINSLKKYSEQYDHIKVFEKLWNEITISL
jgi:glycosyltransferase involved in cell wall biosynthesis